jgi:hypothetical protein
MAAYQRPCPCNHGFPVCACREGRHGKSLRVQSRRLSSLAGWPGVVTEEAAAAVIAEFGGPELAEATGEEEEPPAAGSPWRQVLSWLRRPERRESCGCGQGMA